MWKGPDSYEALKEHNIGRPVQILVEAGYTIFMGGDLSFISTNFGLS